MHIFSRLVLFIAPIGTALSSPLPADAQSAGRYVNSNGVTIAPALRSCLSFGIADSRVRTETTNKYTDETTYGSISVGSRATMINSCASYVRYKVMCGGKAIRMGEAGTRTWFTSDISANVETGWNKGRRGCSVVPARWREYIEDGTTKLVVERY